MSRGLFNEVLVIEVSKRPLLRDVKDNNFRNKSTKESLWEEVKDAIRAIDDTVTVEEIIARWKNLKDAYRRKIKDEKDGKKSESGATAKTAWPHLKQMEFLRDSMETRRRLPRSRRPRLEDPDIIFAALGNGDISDIDDDEEEVDEAGDLDDAVDGDWDNQQELSDSSDEEEPDKESAREYGSWCRKPFEKPAAEFKPVADENESYRYPLLTPYEYFS
ncbi:hypothetical protein V5799_032507, partial [Amblyomma americanum]